MRVQKDRMIRDFETLNTFNATPGPGEGITRLPYSPQDRQAKEYLQAEMKKIGLTVWEDGFCTTFGRREGTDPGAPAVLVGSHYDTVTNGGAFDGPAGVISALEALRVITEQGLAHTHPIEVVAMNAEEGCRFGVGTGVANSRAMAGTFTDAELDETRDAAGVTRREAMRAYGSPIDFASAKREKGSIKSWLEMHIEQGTVLERGQKDIGLIDLLPGIGRYDVRFTGVSSDASTPMKQRQDALAAAAGFIVAATQRMEEIGEALTMTIGHIDVDPNNRYFIAGSAAVTIDLRIFDAALLRQVDFKREFAAIAAGVEAAYRVKTELRETARRGYPNPTAPTIMDAGTIAGMQRLCGELGYQCVVMNGSAGHDTMIMAELAPVNMIFVPSRSGISHHPDEWTDYEQIEKGANLLLHTVLHLAK